jgi:hypothetical protein
MKQAGGVSTKKVLVKDNKVDKDNRALESGQEGIAHSRYVTYYFTNFPAYLSLFYLRKGFEVCGILEDVFIAKKRNVHGQPYGFVKFSKVRDVGKLEKALNAVTFGQFRVRASVASFDRAARKPVGSGRGGEQKNSAITAGVNLPGVERRELKLGVGVPAAPESGPVQSVRVGNVMVALGVHQETDCERTSTKATGLTPKAESVPSHDNSKGIYLRKYRSVPEDVKWARSGVVATVSNGEVIPVVRRRIADAGFSDLEVLHLGADKVFVRSLAGSDVALILENAREFFNHFFSHWVSWEGKAHPFQRGAWVRLYGVPLHAWSESFFKLCVFDCGRFLRADNFTVDKDRLDFARILIATSSLSVIKRVERLLVDDFVVDVQVVEEWGFDMGDDACSLLDDRATEASLCDDEEDRCNPEASQHVDKIVEEIADGLARVADTPISQEGVVKQVSKCFNSPLCDERMAHSILEPK